MIQTSLIREFRRKALHLLACIIPCGLYFFPEETAFPLLLSVTAAAVAVELLRRYVPALQTFFMSFFGPLLRAHETGTFTGSTCLLLSSSLCATLLLNTDGGAWVLTPAARVALFYAFSFIILGDASAAIFGKLFGRRTVVGEKTWVGMFACFATGCLVYGVSLLFISDPPSAAPVLAIAALTALLEVVPVHLDDNLFVPPFTCFTLYLLLEKGLCP